MAVVSTHFGLLHFIFQVKVCYFYVQSLIELNSMKYMNEYKKDLHMLM